MHFVTRNLKHPYGSLIVCFLGWKALLLLVAFCSPGLGYDTSTSLLLQPNQSKELSLISKLVRWDAFYFVKTAERGYLFEQEWAFGWGFTRLIAFCTQFLKNAAPFSCDNLESWVAVFIAHVAHLISTLVVFKLSLAVLPKSPRSFALTAALLHIIAPAGIFLSAPYAESSCALLSFVGCLVFTNSFASDKKTSAAKDFNLLLSGALFGLATTLRSNGILNGLLLFEEALITLMDVLHDFQFSSFRRLLAAGFGGISVAIGFLLPQYIAYQEYCGDSFITPRPWCQKTLPSIYSFVQDHYWYWTVSNIPLFALGTPVFFILIVSGMWGLQHDALDSPDHDTKSSDVRVANPQQRQQTNVLRNMAASQLLLVVITLTTAHVQIITRLASAYPVWLWYLATPTGSNPYTGMFIRFMVIYGISQAGLYASFLPPA